MILIADSGTTKCDWVILDDNKKVVLKMETEGINPRILDIYQICNILHKATELHKLKEEIKGVYFYGAGCSSGLSKSNLILIFKDFFPNATLVLEDDIVAAVYGTTLEAGVVCILGTGSNCCYYDGKKIIFKHESLGYKVMDEGSGNYFGKQLLQAHFYNKMPYDLKKLFEEQFDLKSENVLNKLYENENTSAYLASFAPFLIKNRTNSFISSIVKNGISIMFNNLVSCYEEELKTKPIHFVGSIAFYLQYEIFNEAKKRGYKIGSFNKRPIHNLINNISQYENDYLERFGQRT